MFVSQLICLSVRLSSCPSPFIRRKFTTNKKKNPGIFFFYIYILFLFFNEIHLWRKEKKTNRKKNNATKTENTKKNKKLKHNLVIPHTTQDSKELGRSHILQAHVKVQRCIYRFKKKSVHVEIICACVRIGVSYKRTLPSSFGALYLIDLVLGWQEVQLKLKKMSRRQLWALPTWALLHLKGTVFRR